MASVYLCTDIRTNDRVAVKVLREELGSRVTVERFLREIDFSSQLNHPRIPKVLDSGIIGELPFYVMTYVEGESLGARIKREKQLPIDEAIEITCAVAEPMTYAHERGIVHRDIKPENILLAADGVYVLDFGVARAIVESASDRLTSTGVAVGTPAYMSPEQALGDKDLDLRSDIYSLGCVMYEMIAGIQPFVGPTAQVVMSRRFVAPPPPLRELRESVPDSVEQAIMRALAKSPTDRWETAAEFSRALCVQGSPTTGRTFAARGLGRRRLAGRVIAAIILVAFAGVGAYVWTAAAGSGLVRARKEIRDWNFDHAEAELRSAVERRPADPVTQLWLAQVMMLRGTRAGDWKPFILYGNDQREGLGPEEQKRLDALIALNSGNFAEACPHFAELIEMEKPKDRTDFSPTLAFADCLRDDPAVLPDPSSPSGHRFRASWHLADSLYGGLLERHSGKTAAYRVILPRLERVLKIDKTDLRAGVMPGAGLEAFMAQPSLRSDTVGYLPYPVSESGSWRNNDSGGLDAALARNRQRLRAIAGEWVRVAPKDPAAHEQLALSLELTGELTGAGMSAFSEVNAARKLSAKATETGGEQYLQRIRLASDEVRLNMRLSRFDRAGMLADSILRWPAPAALDDSAQRKAADVLLSMAALRGRGLRAIEIEQRFAARQRVRLPNGQVVTLPSTLGFDLIALSFYATFGGSKDSILAMSSRVSDKVTALFPASQEQAMRRAILTRPLTLAAPVIGPQPVADLGETPELRVSALRALARGDRRRSLRLLDSLVRERTVYAPGEVTMDAVLGEAWLRLALGDTTGATRGLDNALRGFPAALPNVLRRSYRVASLVRAMALRAELAGHAGQQGAARQWADAVFVLWGKGDLTTAPTLDTVRRFR